MRRLPWLLLASHRRFHQAVVAGALVTSLVHYGLFPHPAQAQATPYCQQLPEAIAKKEQLRQTTLRGNQNAQKQYQAVIAQHAEQLRKCRSQNWPQTEATWIRLYPCDAQPGSLDAVMDRIVNRGYNQVYVEAFYNGQVLLPESANPTVWKSVLAGTKVANVDLLAQAIRKGRERGLKVSAWLFAMNLGSDYFQRSDKQQSLARNGLGQTSLTGHEAFVDPYSTQARQDYAKVVQAIAQHKPDSMVFDYIRYPLGNGDAFIASKAQDLWIYGVASYRTLLGRASNRRGMELIQRYLSQGFITVEDLQQTLARFPSEGEPMWQSRATKNTANLPIAQRVTTLQAELWQLVVSHAGQGVLDFLNTAVVPAQRAGIPVGAAFFPNANATFEGGYDSRLQFWDRFPTSIEWHPMAYGVCGRSDCIVAQIQRVLQQAPQGTTIKPILAGIWQESISNRPPLENQMQEVYRIAPYLRSVSHFAYSWQEPGSDRDRKYCQP